MRARGMDADALLCSRPRFQWQHDSSRLWTGGLELFNKLQEEQVARVSTMVL